ncbi:hypothetical protein BKA70DRAFT_1272688 [Coprinopsis sp. MPI-PUGE-AT-0042]|nr:hypothetical protein BKA70DRAFT_1272688 [Coprinopsis sp. MPI-PUGE-AT-0042]
MASPSKRCPTCRLLYPIATLNTHRVHAHEAAECQLCDHVFDALDDLELHTLAGPLVARHLTKHLVKCMLPGCNPRLCFGGISIETPGPVPSTEHSNGNPPTISALSASLAALSLPPDPVPPAAVRLRKNNPHFCYVCNRSLQGANGLQMHMKTSTSHRQLHAKLCRGQNCDPQRCFGGPATNGQDPVARSVEGSASKQVTTPKSGTTAPAARCLMPVPPKPVAAGSPGAPMLAPGSPSSSKAQAKPKRTNKKKPMQPKNTSSNGNFDVSDDDEPFFWQAYVGQRASMLGRQLDLDGEVEYDSRGEGWCIFCHGPSGGSYYHSCPGYSD